MPIQQLEVSDFRNLHSLKIAPSPSINWIVGANGSGKSSLLEAIYFIGTGKSFRTNVPKQYINRDAKKCIVFSSLATSSNAWLPVSLGLEREVGGSSAARCNGTSFKKLSELARYFPLVTLLPDSLMLIEGEPSVRREFLDWTMFHVEHQGDYFEVYRNFQRVLHQRNQLLKSFAEQHYASTEEINRSLLVWDEQFVHWGDQLSQLRNSFVNQLFDSIVSDKIDIHDIGLPSYELSKLSFIYSQGWSASKSLMDALLECRSRDLERGTTGIGPQRFDIKISYNGVPVREYFSRGQKKHLVSICKIRQAEMFRQSHADGDVIFLFDDVFSELDRKHAVSIISRLRQLGVQVFATCVEPPETKGFSIGNHDKMFHVEHGSLCLEAAPNHREHI